MAEFGFGKGARAEVFGRGHATGRQDTDQGVEEWVLGVDAAVQGISQSSRAGDIKLHVPLLRELVLELFEILRRGSGVSTEQGRLRKGLVDLRANSDVGEKHELLDQAISVKHSLSLDVRQWIAHFVTLRLNADFRGGKVQSTGVHTLLAENLGEF